MPMAPADRSVQRNSCGRLMLIKYLENVHSVAKNCT